jgi:membrane protease YdiL (CAAX protease family)
MQKGNVARGSFMENQEARTAATSQPSPVPPFEAALVIIVTFFLSIVISAIFLLTVGMGPTLVIGELVILLIPLSYLILKRVNIKTFVGIDLKPRFILLGAALGVALLFVNIVVSGALTSIFGVSQAVQESNTLLTSLSRSPSGLIAVVASLALAGVCEEFAFRGFLQNSISRTLRNNAKYSKYSFIIAALISAAVFGIFHFDPQGVYILSAAISGIVLGYIYHRWNYVTTATAHSTMNLIVLVLLLFGL